MQDSTNANLFSMELASLFLKHRRVLLELQFRLHQELFRQLICLFLFIWAASSS